MTIHDQRRFLFNTVRDITYVVPVGEWGQADHCCVGKHQILKPLLEATGLEVRPRFCEFNWEDLQTVGGEGLPAAVLDIHRQGVGHIYLEAWIANHGWRTVDATWDKGLQGVFPINSWEDVMRRGSSPVYGMKIAVPPKIVHSPEKSMAVWDELATQECFEDDLRVNGRFYEAFNSWLASIRSSDA